MVETDIAGSNTGSIQFKTVGRLQENAGHIRPSRK